MSRHPVEVIQRILELQDLKNATHFNYACPKCGYVSRQQIPRSEVHRFSADEWQLFPDDMRVYCVILQCSKPGCHFHVVVLAPFENDADLSDVTSRVGNWMADDAACATGSRPMRPFGIRIAKPWPFR